MLTCVTDIEEAAINIVGKKASSQHQNCDKAVRLTLEKENRHASQQAHE